MGSASTSLFGDSGAGDMQQAAREQDDRAHRNYSIMKDITDQAVSAGSLQFEKDIANQEKNLARQEQMISQIDPTIIEASQQVLRLMKGDNAGTLAPLQRQRDMQRQKLMNSLRAQLGPGAESTSAGLKALTAFDNESANLFAGAQQQAIGQLGQTAGQFNAVRPDMFREILGRSNFGQGKSNLLFRQGDALQQSLAGMLQTAGGESAARAMNQQQNTAFGMKLFDSAIQGGMMALGMPPGGSSKVSDMGSVDQSSNVYGSASMEHEGFAPNMNAGGSSAKGNTNRRSGY